MKIHIIHRLQHRWRTVGCQCSYFDEIENKLMFDNLNLHKFTDLAVQSHSIFVQVFDELNSFYHQFSAILGTHHYFLIVNRCCQYFSAIINHNQVSSLIFLYLKRLLNPLLLSLHYFLQEGDADSIEELINLCGKKRIKFAFIVDAVTDALFRFNIKSFTDFVFPQLLFYRHRRETSINYWIIDLINIQF